MFNRLRYGRATIPVINESDEEVRLYLVCTYAAPAAVIKYISCALKK